MPHWHIEEDSTYIRAGSPGGMVGPAPRKKLNQAGGIGSVEVTATGTRTARPQDGKTWSRDGYHFFQVG